MPGDDEQQTHHGHPVEEVVDVKPPIGWLFTPDRPHRISMLMPLEGSHQYWYQDNIETNHNVSIVSIAFVLVRLAVDLVAGTQV